MSLSPFQLRLREMKNGTIQTTQQERKSQPKKPIKPVSAKRQELNKVYRKKSKPMWEGERCAIKSPVCSGMAQGWNHAAGKENADKLLDMKNGQPACNKCNTYCEDHHQWAVDNGFRNQRNSQTNRYNNTYKK